MAKPKIKETAPITAKSFSRLLNKKESVEGIVHIATRCDGGLVEWECCCGRSKCKKHDTDACCNNCLIFHKDGGYQWCVYPNRVNRYGEPSTQRLLSELNSDDNRYRAWCKAEADKLRASRQNFKECKFHIAKTTTVTGTNVAGPYMDADMTWKCCPDKCMNDGCVIIAPYVDFQGNKSIAAFYHYGKGLMCRTAEPKTIPEYLEWKAKYLLS